MGLFKAEVNLRCSVHIILYNITYYRLLKHILMYHRVLEYEPFYRTK